MDESLCLLDHLPKRKQSKRLVILRSKGLGITPAETRRLSLEELKKKIKKNFRQRVKLWHPDRHNASGFRNIRYQRLTEAYHYLMDLEGKTVDDPIHFYPLPWDWGIKSRLPKGWHHEG